MKIMKVLKTTKCWICDNAYVDSDVKVKDRCYITGKYRCCPHRDCNVKLNQKILVVFYNLKNYVSHLIIARTGQIQS